MPATQDTISQVILVDESDNEIGTAEKLAAHSQGLLHRAFSIFVFREGANGRELLLQQRAHTKYHSPGLWTNTCCSHPSPGESVMQAARRRLKEEFNLEIPLREIGTFQYTAHFKNGLTENELDHVLVGTYDGDEILQPNPEEVANYRWVTTEALKQELTENPEAFTAWLDGVLGIIFSQKESPVLTSL
jgi:isopentenyl-diphosphate Delta-isomerase